MDVMNPNVTFTLAIILTAPPSSRLAVFSASFHRQRLRVVEPGAGRRGPGLAPSSAFSIELGGDSYTFCGRDHGTVSGRDALTVMVLFNGCRPADGFPPGTYDLSDAAASKNVVVTVDAYTRAEDAAGSSTPFATYSSSSADSGGTLTFTNRTDGASAPAYDITLEKVVLPVLKGDGSFPTTVTVRSARVVPLPEGA